METMQELTLALLLVCVVVGVFLIFAVWHSRLGCLLWQHGHLDRTSKHNGGELVASTLKAHGVDWIFTLVGGHISPILVACEKIGIKVVDVRSEATAAFAADGVARLKGTIGVCAVTAGPGLTNTVTAVKNAQMAESPLLLLGGSAATLLQGRGALQDIDQMALFRPLCKFVASVRRLRDIVPTLRRAIQIAQRGTPGPVFVEFPIDTMYSYPDVVAGLGVPVESPGILPALLKLKFGAVQKQVVHWYLKRHAIDLFAGAFTSQQITPLPVRVPRVRPSSIRRSRVLLEAAEFPVILLGSQATLPSGTEPLPSKMTRLVAALEHIGAPCFLGGMSRGLFGRSHELHIRQERSQALKRADLVIMLGAVADFRLDYGRKLRRAKVISVNRGKEAMLKNSDMFWKPAVAVLADPAEFIIKLSSVATARAQDPTWLDTLHELQNQCEENNRRFALEESEVKTAAETKKGSPKHPLNALHLLYQLDHVLTKNSVLVTDGGDFVGTAAKIVRPRAPLRWLDPGVFGTLGVGAGFALAAKLVFPEADVWIIYGDGSLGYSIAEFDTFTRHKLPVTALVGNDACWGQIARDQIPRLGSSVACVLEHTAYHTVATGYGGLGVELGQAAQSQEEIRQVLAKAAEDAKRTRKPVLVNAYLRKSNFRAGSISV